MTGLEERRQEGVGDEDGHKGEEVGEHDEEEGGDVRAVQ